MLKKRKWTKESLRKALRDKLFRRCQGICEYPGCGMPMFIGRYVENSLVCASIDHIQRRDSGGAILDESNLRLIHRYCHMVHNGEREWDKSELSSLVELTRKRLISFRRK